MPEPFLADGQQNVSMAALSKQSPVEPNETCSPARVAMAQKSLEVYWQPLSGVVDEAVLAGLAAAQGNLVIRRSAARSFLGVPPAAPCRSGAPLRRSSEFLDHDTGFRP
jgi:hypothetical protein